MVEDIRKRDDKDAKKAKMKEEAKTLGISYEELKERKKRKKREADGLETTEHKEETKRMKSYSKDEDAGHDDKRRRTRSFDAKEEQEAKKEILTPEEWRKEHNITIQGHGSNMGKENELPNPYFEFSDAPFNQSIQRALKSVGFERPTAIQSQSWPIAIQNKDMICIAKTGSGKTCGFLLPSFHQHSESKGSSPFGGRSVPVLLVLAPTRELSVQILEETQKFGRPIGMRSVCCYGGSPKYPQISALQRGVDVVIATPGRLNDLLVMKKADLSNIKYLVLDEADRMLDMGFEPQIRSIVEQVPKERQTLLFSATWPREIQRLAHDFLKDPIQINVGEVNALVANKDIKQTIVLCDDDEKMGKLHEILKDLTESHEEKPDGGGPVAQGAKRHGKVIVFVAKKLTCHDLANQLWEDGFACDSLHGDRQQWERTKVMQAFKSGMLRMLIATDVAARGLDVKDVEVVINFDMPAGTNAVEDYVHRIGRTGRAGAKGKAYTFFTQGDKKAATQLVEVLSKAEQEIPPQLQAMVRPRFGRGGGRGRGRGGGRYYGGGGRGRGYMNGGGGGYGGRGGGGGYGRGGGRGGYSRGGGRGGYRR